MNMGNGLSRKLVVVQRTGHGRLKVDCDGRLHSASAEIA